MGELSPAPTTLRMTVPRIWMLALPLNLMLLTLIVVTAPTAPSVSVELALTMTSPNAQGGAVGAHEAFVHV